MLARRAGRVDSLLARPQLHALVRSAPVLPLRFLNAAAGCASLRELAIGLVCFARRGSAAAVPRRQADADVRALPNLRRLALTGDADRP